MRPAVRLLSTMLTLIFVTVSVTCADEGNTIYACSFRTNSRLYTIDPIDGEETEIGRMGVEATDIAFSGNRLYGISFSTFFQVNPATGQASAIVPHGFNDLNSLIAIGPNDLNGFYAAAVRDDNGRGGRFVRIDAKTGKATQIGNLGAGLTSMGDFASVNGRLYITLIRQGSETTWLGVVNPATGRATLVADTGEQGIYGLEVRNGILFGATRDGVIMHINPADGKCTRLGSDGIVFGGLAKSP